MSATSSSLLPQPGRAVLRWSENSSSPSREEPVDILRALPSETLIRSALQVNEKTRVYLIKNGYTRIGIVKSCFADSGVFLMEIDIASSDSLTRQDAFPPDPGVLAVDSFLTEEEEEQILSNLDAGSEDPLSGRVVADLNHLLCGITCTPKDSAIVARRRTVTEH